jgi:SNF2 family DNA or RNA helicase
MGNEIKLYNWQKKGIEQASSLDNFALFADCGCISEDSIVSISRGRVGKKIPIADVFRIFHGPKRKADIFCRSFNGERIQLHKIKNVVKSGVKEVWSLSLCDGKKLQLTSDHEVLTKRGFVELSELKLYDEVMIDELVRHKSKVESITYVGLKMTYDIVCEDPYRNFVANGIVVHNCGKTCCVMRILAEKENINKIVYVCPVGVMRNIPKEVDKFFPEFSPKKVFIADAKDRMHQLDFAVNVYRQGMIVINYEALLNKKVCDMLWDFNPDVFIFDESHRLKNPKAKCSKAALNLSRRCNYRYIMSGTPILKSPIDLFMQYMILDGGVTFGKSYFVFRSIYFYDANKRRAGTRGYFPDWRLSEGSEKKIFQRIQDSSIRANKETELDLPERIEIRKEFELTFEQIKVYRELKKYFITWYKGEDGADNSVVATQAVVKLLRLHQICTGYVVSDTGAVTEFRNNPKAEILRETLEEIGGKKCIIWCSFVQNYEACASVCRDLKLQYVFLTGQQDSSEKQEAIDAFTNNPNINVIIANRQAGGVGVNLTAAAYSITYSRNFSLADELQSRDRNYRIGSEIHEKIVKYDLIAKDTVEELVEKAIQGKNDIARACIDGIVNNP